MDIDTDIEDVHSEGGEQSQHDVDIHAAGSDSIHDQSFNPVEHTDDWSIERVEDRIWNRITFQGLEVRSQYDQ